MKTEKEIFDTLREMFKYYENYRNSIGMTKQEATEKTLKSYGDFYQWLNEEK